MHYRERDERLRAILESYGAGGDQFIGLQSAIEELMDDVSADAFLDGQLAERESAFSEIYE